MAPGAAAKPLRPRITAPLSAATLVRVMPLLLMAMSGTTLRSVAVPGVTRTAMRVRGSACYVRNGIVGQVVLRALAMCVMMSGGSWNVGARLRMAVWRFWGGRLLLGAGFRSVDR